MLLAIKTNTNINTDAKLIKSVAKSLVASFKLEGITISMERALEIIKEQYATLEK